jgi:hypothetical protein
MSAGSKLHSRQADVRWVGRVIFMLATAVLLFVLSACAGAGGSLEVPQEVAPLLNPALGALPEVAGSWPVLARPDGIPPEYQAAAESEALQLFINPKNAAILLFDKRSGYTWSSVPLDASTNKKLAGVWKRRSPIPLVVEYTSSDRSAVKAVRPEDMQLMVSPLQSGARVDVVAANNGLALSLLLTVVNDRLEVTIPDASVQESGENGFVSVQVLPFFGAMPDSQAGYIFYPDGAGMLVRFDSSHRSEVQETSRPIYGNDLLEPPTNKPVTFTRQPIVMPVFGLTTGVDAFVGIVTHGDFDASISMARSGEGMPYNRTWAEFVYRRQGMFSLNGEQPVILYEPGRVGGDRQIRYMFINACAAPCQGQVGYTDMAARYRDYLLERGAGRVKADAALMNLRLFMGIEQRTWFLRDFIGMTSFGQAQSMLDTLAGEGVNRLDVTLEGWNNGGARSHYPQRLPVEAELGGDDGLRALADSLHARGQRLFLHDNYLDILPGSNGAFPIMDAVRGVDGLPVGDGEAGYYLNPQVALRQFAAHDIASIAKLGADGLYLQDFAAIAVPDGNLRYPLSRENFAATWMQIAGLSQTALGNASLGGGNLYALNHAARLENVPLESTGYDLSNESVPFYQMAVHGLAQYSGEVINLGSDARRTFLRHVEYGAMPVFALTWNDTALLYRTNANSLWTGQFSTWKDEVVRDYQAMLPLQAVQDQFMSGHEKLAEGVFETRYASGARVIVNYNDEPYVNGSVHVAANDFIVLP